jgi:hypothetical protein
MWRVNAAGGKPKPLASAGKAALAWSQAKTKDGEAMAHCRPEAIGL